MGHDGYGTVTRKKEAVCEARYGREIKQSSKCEEVAEIRNGGRGGSWSTRDDQKEDERGP